MGKNLLKALNGVKVYGCFISLLSILCVVFWSFEFSLAEFAVCGISLWGGDPCDNTEGIGLGVVLVMMAILPIILFIIGIRSMNNKVNPLTLTIFSSTTLVMLVLLDGIFLNMLFNLFNSYIMLALFASIAFSVFPLLYLFRWRKNYTIWYSSPKKKRGMDRRNARRGVEKKHEGYKDDLL